MVATALDQNVAALARAGRLDVDALAYITPFDFGKPVSGSSTWRRRMLTARA
jgi:hypothetical protein